MLGHYLEGKGARARVSLAAVVLCAASYLPAAAAQAWPDRPVRMVVPFSAGGSSDVIARIVGARITDTLRQPVIIDTRHGACT